MTRFAAILLLAPTVSAQFYIRDQKYRFQPEESECSVHHLCAYEESKSPDGHDFSLNFVEVRGNGELFDQRQLDNAVAQIDKATFKDPKTGTRRQKPLVFVYIHGWHNNAQERENPASRVCPDLVGDVAKFRDCGLPLLAHDYSARLDGAPPSVVGIYLAWQGTDFTPASLLAYIVPSYMLRRYAANHVGQTGMCSAVGAILDKVNENRRQYVLAFMGHSFGARVLENASQVLFPGGPCGNNALLQYRRQLDNTANMPALDARAAVGPDLQAPADLVFYVNAAAPDTFTQKTINGWNTTCNKLRVKLSPDQMDHLPICSSNPFYTSVTSRTDFATGLVMPVANLAFFWYPVSLSPPSFELTPLSAANSFWMHTHHDAKNIGGQPCPDKNKNGICFPVPIASHGPNSYSENYDVEPIKDVRNRFWIMNIGHYFIRNHGDVWNLKIFSMIQDLLKRNSNYIAAVAANEAMRNAP